MAPRMRWVPDLDRIVELRRDGMSWDRIGDEFGVTGETVRKYVADHGGDTGDGRVKHVGVTIPWDVKASHKVQRGNGLVFEMLVRNSNRIQGRKMDQKDEEYLDAWLRWMDGANEWNTPLAVHYSHRDGFSIRRRRDADVGVIATSVGTRELRSV